jgi:hypothetical protein
VLRPLLPTRLPSEQSLLLLELEHLLLLLCPPQAPVWEADALGDKHTGAIPPVCRAVEASIP